MILKKNYINGIGTDNILAYDVDESTNQGQISFCQNRVLAYQSEFTSYGYTSIVNDCNNIQSSGTGIVTNRYYYHTNQLGSVIAITNSTGNVVQVYSYDSFGKVYVNNSGTLTSLDTYSGSIYSNTRLYTGRELDKETGMYYLRARYYNSDTGKFISRDPVGQNDQINLYTYVKNNPLGYTDRNGRKASQLLGNIWNGYLKKSEQFGVYMYDSYSENKNEILGVVDRTRQYSGNVGLAATPFLFFPPTTPIAVGIIGTTGIMSFGAGGLESGITGDLSYVAQEGFGLTAGFFGGKLLQGALKNAGKVSDVVYNSSAGRYMGRQLDGAYGFVKNTAGQMSLAVSQTTEQIAGWIGQKGME